MLRLFETLKGLALPKQHWCRDLSPLLLLECHLHRNCVAELSSPLLISHLCAQDWCWNITMARKTWWLWQFARPETWSVNRSHPRFYPVVNYSATKWPSHLSEGGNVCSHLNKYLKCPTVWLWLKSSDVCSKTMCEIVHYVDLVQCYWFFFVEFFIPLITSQHYEILVKDRLLWFADSFSVI